MTMRLSITLLSLAFVACAAPKPCDTAKKAGSGTPPATAGDPAAGATLPLCVVDDVVLPGASSRFDYQDIDAENGHLIVAHMGDSEVLIVNLADGAVLSRVAHVGTVRGVLAAPEAHRLYASASSTDELVIIDAATLAEVNRVPTGDGPDGIAYDAADHVVAVSAQHAGTVSLIAGDGDGARVDVAVGNDTGNVAFDATRGHFFVTVTSPDQLVELNPTTHEVLGRVDVAGCSGAHGLRIHPDGKSALIACEDNATLARVALDGAHDVVTAGTGLGPDVLSVDAGLGWIYVAAESGDLKIFDIGKAGLTEIDSEHVGDNAHSVAVDAVTHRAFFPLPSGNDGKPTLRIMAPTTTP